MRNTTGLPFVSLILAAILIVVVLITHGIGDDPLTELELGATAAAVAFIIYGAQGLISVVLEGTELRPGRRPPHLTGPLTTWTVVLSFVLLLDAITLAFGVAADWGPIGLGFLAGGGCLILAFLLVGYKEAFLGEEARFDQRDDGVPW